MLNKLTQHQALSELLPKLILIGLRAASLAIKFVLLILMGRYFTFYDIGIYGLLVAISLVYAQMAGWGLGFNLNRRLLEADHEKRQELIARLWGILSYTYIVTTLLFLAVKSSSLQELDYIAAVTTWACLIIVICEHASQELTCLFISVKKAMKGNILLFIRTAGWAIPMSVAIIFFPETRNIDDLLLVWAIGEVISVILGFIWLAHYVYDWSKFFKDALHIPMSWIKKYAGSSALIYVSFSISVILSYINRFMTGAYLTIDETGLYTLYWTIINAIYILATTGFVQTAYPGMLEKRHDKTAYHHQALTLYKHTVIFVVLAGGALAVVAPFLFQLMGKAEAVDFLSIFYLMLLGGIIRVFATVAFYTLYARHDDKDMTRGMIASLILSIPISLLCITQYGLWGAALSDCLFGVIMFAVLTVLYIRNMRQAA